MKEEAPFRDGQLIKPTMASDGGYFMQCCDCGLVHRIDFFNMMASDVEADLSVVSLEMRVYRDEERTLAARDGVADWWFGPKRFREINGISESRPVTKPSPRPQAPGKARG